MVRWLPPNVESRPEPTWRGRSLGRAEAARGPHFRRATQPSAPQGSSQRVCHLLHCELRAIAPAPHAVRSSLAMATWLQEKAAIFSYCATNSDFLHNRHFGPPRRGPPCPLLYGAHAYTTHSAAGCTPDASFNCAFCTLFSFSPFLMPTTLTSSLSRALMVAAAGSGCDGCSLVWCAARL